MLWSALDGCLAGSSGRAALCARLRAASRNTGKKGKPVERQQNGEHKRVNSSGLGEAEQTGGRQMAMRMRIGPTLLAAVIAMGAAPPVQAQKLDLSGQKITLAIATPSGGGYDLYGRLVARHLGNYLPGNPTIVPQNMPGAGSLIAANWLYNTAPKDGTALAIIPSATMFENLLGNANARFDA